MATDWQQTMKDTVQPHVAEPVVAVGMLQPAGTWGSMGLHYISPLAGMLKRRSGNKKAGGMAKSGAFKTKIAMLAVTADKLYAFNASPKGRKWKVEDQVGVWSRSDVRASTDPGRLATKVVLDIASTGEHYELEATTIGSAGFNDAFLAEVTRNVAA
jgi:hypothetical protein